jgi:uracil-DNA glycosylase
MKSEVFLKQLNYLAPSFKKLDGEWQELLITCCGSKLLELDIKLQELSKSKNIFPPSPLILNAFSQTPFNKLSVVILGQDPYHGKGEANGLAFAVNQGIRLPPSLKNIFQELKLEYNVDTSKFNGELLSSWAQQGVLLLNATLTVIENQPNSLESIGWQEITDQIIHVLSQKCEHLVYMLWGAFAKKKEGLIEDKHLKLIAPHPSPFSAARGFFGCNHFKLANQYLVKNGKKPINWIK